MTSLRSLSKPLVLCGCVHQVMLIKEPLLKGVKHSCFCQKYQMRLWYLVSSRMTSLVFLCVAQVLQEQIRARDNISYGTNSALKTLYIHFLIQSQLQHGGKVGVHPISQVKKPARSCLKDFIKQ